MLSKAAPEHLDLSTTQHISRRAGNFVTRKIWLPRVLYDSLPYFYLTAGFAAFFATLYISDWFWVLPHYLLFSAACVHLSFAVLHRRRKKRAQSTAAETNSGEPKVGNRTPTSDY